MSITTEIKARVNMLDILNKYGVEVNNNNFCCCPLHSEKTASFSIYGDNKQFFKCFGCGAGGDIIKFVMLYENVPFKIAIQNIAYQFGITYTGNKPMSIREKNERLKRAREKEEKEKAYNNLMEEYKEALSEHCKWWNDKIKYTPKSIDDFNDSFTRAHAELEKVQIKILNIEEKLKQWKTN